MILVAIGSNLNSDLYGSPYNNCIEVIKFLEKYFLVSSVSKFYETEPMPKSDQPWYVNCVICIKTDLKPLEILSKMLHLEIKFGRIRKFKNEPRIIDLDLLSYNDIILNDNELILPHPRMHLRRFVMQPICDLDPEWVHPVIKKKSKSLLKSLAKQKIFYIND